MSDREAGPIPTKALEQFANTPVEMLRIGGRWHTSQDLAAYALALQEVVRECYVNPDGTPRKPPINADATVCYTEQCMVCRNSVHDGGSHDDDCPWHPTNESRARALLPEEEDNAEE